LKPWAESCSPFGARPEGPWISRPNEVLKQENDVIFSMLPF
jgi:hypothetical protein